MKCKHCFWFKPSVEDLGMGMCSWEPPEDTKIAKAYEPTYIGANNALYCPVFQVKQ